MEVDVSKEKAPVAVGSLTTNITAAVIIEESNLNEHKHSSFKIFFNEKKMYVRLCLAFQSIRNTNNDVNEISYFVPHFIYAKDK